MSLRNAGTLNSVEIGEESLALQYFVDVADPDACSLPLAVRAEIAAEERVQTPGGQWWWCMLQPPICVSITLPAITGPKESEVASESRGS